MSNDSKIKQFIASLKEKKHIEIVIAVLAVVVMLILYFSIKVGTNKTSEEAGVIGSDYCERVEKELVSALENMKGVGKVKLVVNWESGVETVIAYATATSSSGVTTTPTLVQSQGSSKPIVLKEIYPKALGVVIICQGGNNVSVKLDVMNAVSVLLGISQNKVNVFAMK